ncbi:AAA family ATPase [Pedobacter insulae]|uniref:AAA domain-containing protein, putative AbiEii toxin, Type IV TA system n=1 Tax=Pedobacter insulae TaxID=414048 RepID=A0A1I2WZG5_9SPHI|nr:AAA family ATPase [Pedobacter insulae]SFH05051.1 AAA domain-containing protein, putative AbiEii toxin, Type IV TA system [Pedobacter insulae]
MRSQNFIITELRIHSKCNEVYKKILKEDTYHFNQLDLVNYQEQQSLERSIFGKRVFIQAIVGKNGSGKSSVLEIIYRIINNFSYYILDGTQMKRVSAEPIYLIEELYADLDFIIDDVKCSFMVRDKSLGIIRGEEKFYFGNFDDDFFEFSDFKSNKNEGIVKLVSSFFYTIVTNYSFQSLITKDFEKDIAREFIGSKEKGYHSNGNWLDSLFRKNDGYVTPIVLNPYRDEGKIDLQKEYDLTLSRIAALLIHSKHSKKDLLSGYSLSTIQYKANHSHFLKKLFIKYNESDDSIHLTELMAAMVDKTSVASQIIQAYGFDITQFQNEDAVVPYAYLIYKTLSVLSKYAQFEAYINVPEIRKFGLEITEEQKIDLLAGISEIKTFKSHVNIKIYQTLNYINSYNNLIKAFNLEEYIPYKDKKRFGDIDDIIHRLPPPFFEQDIRLLRNENEEKDLPLSSLSSGERQFIYTIGTIVYHIKNLLSIQQSNRIRYRNVNLILDEVEICFHPEYQRQFIAQLLDLMDRLNLTRSCSFNILIVTHSPFILSDIPKNNILYLKDGKQYPDEGLINPFAANINDILYQSFFLEGGFMGEHAKNQIVSAVSALERIIKKQKVSVKSLWNKQSLLELIEMTGEPLLRENLFGLYTQAFDQPSYEDQLIAKDEEIDRLQRLLDKRNGGKS